MIPKEVYLLCDVVYDYYVVAVFSTVEKALDALTTISLKQPDRILEIVPHTIDYINFEEE